MAEIAKQLETPIFLHSQMCACRGLGVLGEDENYRACTGRAESVSWREWSSLGQPGTLEEFNRRKERRG